jgi:hypothetical protein
VSWNIRGGIGCVLCPKWLKLSSDVNECKPLAEGQQGHREAEGDGAGNGDDNGRGLWRLVLAGGRGG